MFLWMLANALVNTQLNSTILNKKNGFLCENQRIGCQSIINNDTDLMSEWMVKIHPPNHKGSIKSWYKCQANAQY